MFCKEAREGNRRAIRHILAWLWGKTILVVMLAGAAAGLTVVANQPRKRSAEADGPDRPGSGITVRIDLTDIWVPARILDLAERESTNPKLLSGKEFNRLLKYEGGEIPWNAVTLELHQADGGTAEITTIDHPHHSNRPLRSFRDLLDEIAGRLHVDASPSSRAPAVHLIPEALLRRPPREAVEELLKDRSNGR